MRPQVWTHALPTLAAVVAVLELSACSSRVSYIRGPDGKEWIAVRCSRREAVEVLDKPAAKRATEVLDVLEEPAKSMASVLARPEGEKERGLTTAP